MCEHSHDRKRRSVAAGLPILAALGAMGVAAWAGPAAAANDRKTFPGSSCTTWGNSSAPLSGSDGGAIRNADSASAYTASCPIVRDNTLNVNGLFQVVVYAYRDGVTATQLTCIFKNTNATTGTDFVSVSRSTGSTGNVTLTIPVTSSNNSGFYNMLCILPARSKIYGYLVEEY